MKQPSRLPDCWTEARYADRCIEVFIRAGCARCARRLIGDDVKIMGQVRNHQRSLLGWRIVCDVCMAEIMGKGEK